MISEIQWTPDINLPITINATKIEIAEQIIFLRRWFLMRISNCIIAVVITLMTSIVVDDGYEASRYPFISTGL